MFVKYVHVTSHTRIFKITMVDVYGCNTNNFRDWPQQHAQRINKILIALTLVGHPSWFEKLKSIYTTEVILI
jgi:hypothetical protein